MARVALVTGGQRGIGAAISEGLRAAGRTVVASYAGNDAAAKAFTDRTGIPCYKFDVADYAQCAEAIAKIEAEVGQIEILVNNAGIGHVGTMATTVGHDLDRMYAVNVRGVFNVTKAFIGDMLKNKSGNIINLASIGGVVAVRGPHAAYLPGASPYLDAHGEEDPHLSRGRPLFLSAGRAEALAELWRNHLVGPEVARLRAGADRIIKDSYY